MEQTTSSPASASTPAPAAKNNNWIYILGGCCCLLLIGLIVTGVIVFYYLGSTAKSTLSNDWQSFDNAISNNSDNIFSNDSFFNNLSTDNTDNYSSDTATKTTGTLEGSLSYPGEQIPSDLKVCAENIFYSDQVYCADKLISDPKYTNSTGYQIEAPVGSYYVYAYSSSKPDTKAYYTKFVDCGLKAECTDHDKLISDVYPDETTSNVDPIDWYNQQ